MALSIILKYLEKDKWGIGLLFIAAFIIRLFMAHLDPYLHDWDEKFHALVARNMMDNPFKPMLRAHDIFTHNDYKAWCCNYVWLHKQPLFMWQMALSMKVFGVSEYAIRYPSVLMGAVSILLVYRITILLSANKLTAYAAAFFMCLSPFQLYLISGEQGMDHNDVAFSFYVLASIWAYAEYSVKQKLSWAIWIGIFAGCAILNKWLTGLLVYAAWGLHILFTIRRQGTWQQLKPLLVSLLVCTIIFLPWQLYILYRFPAEASYEYAHNSRHISEVVEGHDGNIWYYWYSLNFHYGSLWLLIIPGLLVYIFSKAFNNRIKYALLAFFLLTFTFFSFIVKTKLHGYFFIVVPIGYILLAYLITQPIIKLNKYFSLFLMLCSSYFLLQGAKDLSERSADHNPTYRQAKINNTRIYKELHRQLPPGTKTVVGLMPFSDVELMFYNPGITAYAYYLGEKDFEYFEKNKIKVAVFKDYENFFIPDYVRWYTYGYIIDKKLSYIY